jgi:hypothetical protein
MDVYLLPNRDVHINYEVSVSLALRASRQISYSVHALFIRFIRLYPPALLTRAPSQPLILLHYDRCLLIHSSSA